MRAWIDDCTHKQDGVSDAKEERPNSRRRAMQAGRLPRLATTTKAVAAHERCCARMVARRAAVGESMYACMHVHM